VEKRLEPRRSAKKKTARRAINESVLVDVVVEEMSRSVATEGVEVEDVSDASVHSFSRWALLSFPRGLLRTWRENSYRKH
jgi:hypothetical protein